MTTRDRLTLNGEQHCDPLQTTSPIPKIEKAFHEKAGRSQAESLSIPIHKQGFSPPS